MDKSKLKLKLSLNFKRDKTTAIELPDDTDKSKIYFTGTLAHGLPQELDDYPIANKNGEGFLSLAEQAPDFIDNPIGLKEAVETVVDSALNLIHDPSMQIGHIKKAEYVEETEDEAARIDFLGVLNKETLDFYDLDKRSVARDFDLSMEALYENYFYIWGEDIISAKENPQLEEYVGDTYKNLGVVRIITDPEFVAAGLIVSGGQADKDAIIKSVASKNKEKKQDEQDDTKGGKKDMAFKEFETEEEFNNFKEDLLKGYASVDELLNNFADELDIEEDSIEEVIKTVANTQSDLEETEEKLEEVKSEKTFAERKQKLKDVGVEVEKEDKEEIVNMSKKSFAMLVKSNKEKLDQMEKTEGGFDPNFDLEDDEDEINDKNIADSVV